jgi:chemotaxis protein MotB
MFFESGSQRPTREGDRLLQILAAELGRMGNPIVIEGHTDARPFRGNQDTYTNWELAVDRANAARRVLVARGVRPEQIVEVRGFADRNLLNTGDPNDPRNRRISVVVKLK